MASWRKRALEEGRCGMARTLAVDQVTIPCLVSGSYTVTIDDKDNSLTITPGDTLSIVFNQCNDGIGGIVNGGHGDDGCGVLGDGDRG